MQKLANEVLKQQLVQTSHFEQQFSTDISQGVDLFFAPAQTTIITENEESGYLYYLVRGRVKVEHLMANGKIIIIDFFTPPCFIGEMELVDPNSTTFGVQTLEDCWLLGLSKRRFKSRLLQDSKFLLNVSIYLTHKSAANAKVASENQAFSTSQRLASVILLSEHNGLYQEQHVQIAQYLGTSYRHLLLVFAQFVDKGILRRVKGGYKVLDFQALKNLSEAMS